MGFSSPTSTFLSLSLTLLLPLIAAQTSPPLQASSTVTSEPECTPDATRECPPVGPTLSPTTYPTASMEIPISDIPLPTSFYDMPMSAFGSSDIPLPTSSICVCYSAPCEPCNGTPIPHPQTVYATVVHTITNCGSSSSSCAAGHVSTSTISLSTIAAPVHTTIYTTAYVDTCPTGITTRTYTLTHTCTQEACHGPAPTEIPPHFTTTEKVCGACPGKPTLTVTSPVETETGIWGDGTAAGTAGPGEPPCSGPGCPSQGQGQGQSGGNPAAGGVAAPTGPGSGSGSASGSPSGSACGYGQTCHEPAGNGTSGGPYVTSGTASVLVGGLKVLSIGALVSLLVLML